MKKKLKVLACLLCFTLVLSACSGGDSKGHKEENQEISEAGSKEKLKIDKESFVYPMPLDVSVLNPWYENGDEGFTILKPIFDPLYIVDNDDVRYYLAESHEVLEDGKGVRIKLRDNLQWHDGEKIDADDLVWNIEQKLIPENKATGIVMIDGDPVSYEKVDDLTVDIHFPKISPRAIIRFGGLQIIPKHIYENEADISSSDKNLEGIGSGPYKVKSWQQGSSLELEQFENYYREFKDNNFKKVVFKIMPDISAQEVALQKGEISIMRVSDIKKYEKYKENENFEIYSFPEGRVNYMSFNVNSEKMQDPKVREAITLALDKEQILMGAYGSKELSKTGTTVFDPVTQYVDESISGYEHDLEKAKKLIKEAGFEGETLKLIYNTSRENMKEVAQVIQHQLSEVGITVDIQGYETQGFFSEYFFTHDGQYDLGINGYACFGDPTSAAGMYQWEDHQVFQSDRQHELWEALDSTMNEKEREEITQELQRVCMEDLMIYPVSHPNFILVAQKGIKNLDAIPIVPVFEDYLELYYEE